MIRTHNCGEITKENISEEVVLCGWISSRRDHGDIIFMDLRDKHGITQIVFDPEKNKENHEKAHTLRSEFCVQIKGIVSPRPEGTINEKLNTGQIEIDVKDITLLSDSETPPFEIKDGLNINEEIRLKYRYLDLRRPEMMKRIETKHRTYQFINNYLDSKGFISVETPMLTKSTPEGARDYLVPSRIQAGSFYALPQSPQIFKQLLMVSGVEKYFQIVRCFRDEDLRADRQPEFTQLDMEMSFIDQEDIFGICEGLFKGLFQEVLGVDLKTPFPRMCYKEAMSRYGSDKPDTRFKVFLHDFTEDIGSSDFKIFKDTVSKGGKVMGLCAPGCGNMSRKDIDVITGYLSDYGAKGLAYFKVTDNGLNSPITKFFSPDMQSLFMEKTGAVTGDMIFMVADEEDVVYDSLNALRLKIGEDKGLKGDKKFNFLWVVDFPLFKYNKEEGRWVSEHHPFTSYREEDEKYIESGEYGSIRSNSYDLVLNGSEIGSGSIRIHRRDIQQKIFDILGLTERDCRSKFGFLLDAFNYGPPPHGGIAFGMDRLVTLFTGDTSIREVIPFPKTQKGVCPLTSAPSEVDTAQLVELGIKLSKKRISDRS
jgi:aspartyl-tRNA synthetase